MALSLFTATLLLAFLAIATGTHVITVSKGHSCLPRNTVCASGLICTGTSTRKRCVVPMPAGKRCNTDPFWVCETGLTCESKVCKIPQGGNCISSPSSCVSGTVCVGTASIKRCVVPMTEGGRCNRDPFWVCRDGLVCDDDICKTPKGGSCLSRSAVCVDGTTCAGSSTRKRCVVPMSEGGRCNTDPFWVCRTGLQCVNNICNPPLGSGELCDSGRGVCASGLSCVGTRREKRCFKLQKENKRCGVIGFIRCASGLVCLNNRCVPGVIPMGKPCNGSSQACVDGTVCGGRRGRMICVTAMGRGKRCDVDPYWKCSPDLQCVHNRCVRY